MENIQTLLARHETLKGKGLRLTDWDIMEWIWIYDWFIDISVELESEYEEMKRQLDNEKDTAHILLKEKEWGSDKIVEAKVKKEYEDQTIALAVMKKQRNLAKAKLDSINHYINQAKRVVK